MKVIKDFHLLSSRDLRGLHRGCAVLLLSLLAVWGTASGQQAEIQGVVTDSSKSVIPGADVTITNVETGTVRNTITNDSGFYSAPLLKEGTYTVKCAMPGFSTQETTIKLDFDQVARVDFQLRVGEITDVIEVTATAARVQTKAQNVGTVVEEKQIHELPLDGRNYLSLAGLAPGVIRGGQGGRGEGATTEGGFRSGGLAYEHTMVTVDGADNSTRVTRGILSYQAQAMKPAVEAVSEFKILTNNVSAEYGYKAGAQVMVSTKSGTNELRGSLYEFHRNDALAANNFMYNRDAPRTATGEIDSASTPRPVYIRNQFGGTLGGPIVKNKTFFFYSLQATTERSSGGSFTQSVPSRLAKQGNFSQEKRIGTATNRIFDPLSLVGTGATARRTTEFPNAILPKERWDPVAAKFAQLFPDPNRPGMEYDTLNYFFVKRDRKTAYDTDARIDHEFNENHRLFGRWSYRNDERVLTGALPSPAAAAQLNRFYGTQVSVNYNMSLGPKKHNEFRFGLTHFPTNRWTDADRNLNQEFGMKGSSIEQHPELIPKGWDKGWTSILTGRYANLLGEAAGGTLDAILDTRYFADSFMMDLGKHSLKFGGEYRYAQTDRRQGYVFGYASFDNRYTAEFPNNAASRAATGHVMADLLLGWGYNVNNEVPVGEKLGSPYWGFFIQDDWRVTPRLTVNLGLRYELFLGPNFLDFGEGDIAARPIFSGNLFDETVDILDYRFEGWRFPQSDSDCGGCIIDKNNWAPRIGIAYRLFDKTVIRAGGGLYYSDIGSNAIQSSRFIVGLGKNVNSFQNWARETTGFHVQDGFPPTTISELDPNAPFSYMNMNDGYVPDYMPATDSGQWFLDIQHQFPQDILLTVGYSGQAQSHIPYWSRNATAPLTGGVTTALERRRTPTDLVKANMSVRMNQLNVNENILNGNYNRFHTKVEKRFAKGLSFLSSFTWSKALDYHVSSIMERTEGVAGSGIPPSPLTKELWRNYGLSGLHRKFAYSASCLYELPFGPGKAHLTSGLASWILGGWQMGTILTFQTGAWATHSFSPDYANTGGAYRGNLIGNPNLPVSERDSMRWFDASVFVAGQPGEFGNAGRALIELPGYKNIDFLMSKNFPMPWEGHKIQFRFEAFNLTNSANLGTPQSNLAGGGGATLVINENNPDASTTIQWADDPRIIQFALKYLF
ncbi:MAG: TonB-dependent receptor domain-containing protein [Acidobacteriota bacterium]